MARKGDESVRAIAAVLSQRQPLLSSASSLSAPYSSRHVPRMATPLNGVEGVVTEVLNVVEEVSVGTGHGGYCAHLLAAGPPDR